MNVKKLIPLLASVVLLFASVSLSTVAYSQTEERKVCYYLNWGVFKIEIVAPIQAWPGDTMNVTINAEASAEIHVELIDAVISCLKDNLTETQIGTINFLKDFDFSSGEKYEQHYEVVIPEDALPGLIYGELQYSWDVKGEERIHIEDAKAFQVTFVQNKAYEDLRQAYDALNSFAEDLQANYTSLEANYTDLQQKYQQITDNQIAQNNATGLMYLFLITTGIFVVTTVLLIIRRPKTTTW